MNAKLGKPLIWPTSQLVFTTVVLCSSLAAANGLEVLTYRGPDGLLGSFFGPRITNSGLVAYQATTEAGELGVYLGPISGEHNLIVAQGDHLPGMSSADVLSGVTGVEVNDRGSLIINGRVIAADDELPIDQRFRGSGAWVLIDGKIEPVVVSGHPIPNTDLIGDPIYFAVNPHLGVSLNAHDEIAVVGSAVNRHNEKERFRYVLRGAVENPMIVELAHWTTNAGQVEWREFESPILNDNGDLLYKELDVAGGFIYTGWMHDHNGDRQLVFSGEPDEFGLAGGSYYWALDAHGAVHMSRNVELESEDGRTTRGTALTRWNEDEGLSIVAGHPSSPMTIPGTIWPLTKAELLAANAHGEVVVGVDVDFTVWVRGIDGSRFVASHRAEAPDIADDAVFDASVKVDTFGRYAINDLGQTMFIRGVSGSGIDDGNNEGLWAEDINQNLHLIAREGDQIQFSLEDELTTRSIRTIGESAMNDLGEIVFVAEFDDGSSGLLYSNRVAVPEPGEHILIPASLFMLGILRQRWITARV